MVVCCGPDDGDMETVAVGSPKRSIAGHFVQSVRAFPAFL